LWLPLLVVSFSNSIGYTTHRLCYGISNDIWAFEGLDAIRYLIERLRILIYRG